MKYVVEDEPDLTLPEDSIHRARLETCQEVTVDYTKDGVPTSFTKLEWWWQITSTSLGEQYVGRKVKGECNANLSNRANNAFRVWSEALLGREIPVGMGIDTDDLLGLEAEIVIGHRADRKDPKKIWEFVSDVIPVDGPAYRSDAPF